MKIRTQISAGICLMLFAVSTLSAQSPELVLQTGHSERVSSVAFSPDGGYVISGSEDKTLVLWEVSTGLQLRVFKGHSDEVTSVAFGPDGRYVISGSKDKTLALWEVATGEQIRAFKGHTGGVTSVAFSPDGRYILSGSEDNTARLWEVATGEQIRAFEGHTTSVHSVAFSPDGRYVLSGGGRREENEFIDATVRLWEVETGKQVRVFTGEQRDHLATSVAFSPDGRYVLSGDEDEGALRLWDADTGKAIRVFALSSFNTFATSVAFSPDGRYILSGEADRFDPGAGVAWLWEVETGQPIGEFEGHTGGVNSVAFSPDGERVLTAGSDGTIRLWEVATSETIRIFKGHKSYLLSATFSPDGRYILSGSSDGTLHLWEVATGTLIRIFPGHTGSVSFLMFSPDGRYVLTGGGVGDNTIRLWNMTTGVQIRVFKQFGGDNDQIVSLAFSPDGRYILSARENQEDLWLWDVETGNRLRNFKKGESNYEGGVFSPDGRYVLSVKDRDIQLWNVETGEKVRVFEGHTDGINSVAVSPDGRYVLSASDDKTVRLWEVETGRQVRVFEGHTDDVSSAVFSPDGRYILSDGTWVDDGTVRLWDVERGTQVHVFEEVWGTFSPDGRYMLSLNRNHAIRLWDVKTGQPLHTFEGQFRYPTSPSLAFSPDGRHLLWINDGAPTLWEVETGKEMASLIRINQTDYVTLLPESNFYVASKGALKAIAFRVGNKGFPAEQFDLRYNRPDLVLAQLGKASPETIAAYKRLYQRRLKKMGFSEEMLSADFHLPEVKILSKEIPISTPSRSLVFRIRATDSKYPLDRVNVYLNDVPIYGVGGISLRGQKTQSVERDLEVTLADGNNKIQVSVLNAQGVESLKETFTIRYEGSLATPDVYIVAIGVSQYQDAQYNLQYAAKDAKDLATLYQEQLSKTGKYGAVNVLAITDEEATRENIINAKAFFQQSKADDLAVLFIAGHGLTDDELNYYYAAYDVNFTHPGARGVPYDELENLLDGIPALQKLFLMDTCFSGEIDKAETELVVAEATTQTGSGQVKVRAFTDKRGMKAKQRLSATLSQFQEEMFADLRRGTGAVIIASSSGDEYSFESDLWKNGVFTYCVLRGLKERAADENEDKDISVSELRDYVIEQVPRLTRRGQNPTVRRENLENDFVVMPDIGVGEAIRTFSGHSLTVTSVAFSPDGRYALSTGGGDKTLKLWEVETGQEIRTFQHKASVNATAFSPDGRYVLSGSDDKTIRLWNVDTGEEVRTFQGGATIRTVAFSPDGHYALSGGSEKVLRLWDVETGQEVRAFEGHKNYVMSVTFNPDGRYVASGSMDKTARLWEVETGQEIQAFEGHKAWVRAVAFSPDGLSVISGSDDKTLRLWDIETGQPIRAFEGHAKGVTAVAFSPDGQSVLSGSGDGRLVLWDVKTAHQIRVFEGHAKGVTAVAFSPDGRRVLSGSEDNTLKLWE